MKKLAGLLVVVLLGISCTMFNDPNRYPTNTTGAPIRFRIINNAFGFGDVTVRVNDSKEYTVPLSYTYPDPAIHGYKYAVGPYSRPLRLLIYGTGFAPIERVYDVREGGIYNIHVYSKVNYYGKFLRVSMYREPPNGVYIRFRNNLPVVYWYTYGIDAADDNPEGYLGFGLQPIGESINHIRYFAFVPYGYQTAYLKLNLYDYQTNVLFFLDPFKMTYSEAVTSYTWRTEVLTDTVNLLGTGTYVDLRGLEPGGYYTIEVFVQNYADPIVNSSSLPTTIIRDK